MRIMIWQNLLEKEWRNLDKLFNNIDEIEEYLKLKSTLKQKSINAYFNK